MPQTVKTTITHFLREGQPIPDLPATTTSSVSTAEFADAFDGKRAVKRIFEGVPTSAVDDGSLVVTHVIDRIPLADPDPALPFTTTLQVTRTEVNSATPGEKVIVRTIGGYPDGVTVTPSVYSEQLVRFGPEAVQIVDRDILPDSAEWIIFANYVAQTTGAQTLFSSNNFKHDIRVPESNATPDMRVLLDQTSGGNLNVGSLSLPFTVALGDRISVLISSASGKILVARNGNAFLEVGTFDDGVVPVDWTQGSIRFGKDRNGSAPFVSDLGRAFIWCAREGETLPDIESASVVADLIESDGSVVNPRLWWVKHGTPQFDLWGEDVNYLAGFNQGTEGNATAVGQFDGVDAPTTTEDFRVLDFNLGGLSGFAGATALLNQAKQADGGWFFGGNGTVRVEEYPDHIDANGNPTSLPPGFTNVYLRWSWPDRPAEDFGSWRAEWSEGLNGATPDTFGIATKGATTSTTMDFELTDGGGNNDWRIIFRNTLPTTEFFESLEIYPTAHPQVPNWKTLLDSGKNWSPRFLNVGLVHGINLARLMDMIGTNNYKFSDFSSHPGRNASTWTDGAPFDVLCELVTDIGAKYSQWQFPHTFNESDCAALATLIYPLLPSSHVVNISSTNEVGWQTNDDFILQRLWLYRGALLDFGDEVSELTVTSGQTILPVPDSSIFSVNELVTFAGDGDTAVYKVISTATGPDTITLEELATDGGIQVAQTATLYRLDGLTGGSPNEAYQWHTKRTYELTKAFRDAWVAAGGEEDRCRPVLEAQSADIGVATAKLNPTLWQSKYPETYVDPRTYFWELQIAPYIGGGMDRQADVRAITTDPTTTLTEKLNLIKEYMINSNLAVAPRSIYQRLGEIEAHETLIKTSPPVGMIMEMGFYEGGGGMLQGGPPGGPALTSEEIDFYAAFLKSQQMADVFEVFLQELRSRNLPMFMVFAVVSVPSQFGSYTPIFNVTDVEDETNLAAQWQINLRNRNIPTWSPARLAMEAA